MFLPTMPYKGPTIDQDARDTAKHINAHPAPERGTLLRQLCIPHMNAA